MQFGGRQRLLDLLDGDSAQAPAFLHSSARLTVVCAPIGYGKTSLLSQWLRHADLPASQTIWVHCVPRRPHFQTDTALPPRASFWQNCAESVSFTLGRQLPRHAATFETVYRLVSQLRTPHTLIIDDYHRDTTAITDYEIAELAELNVPLHVLVLSRRLSVLDGPLVSGRDNVQIITQCDLAFTPQETSALLTGAGVERSPSVDRFFESLEGWPLAVTAALADPRGETVPDTAGTVSRAPVSQFEDNLSRFVLHQVEVMGEAARSLLLSAALLESISLELAANVAGLNFDTATTALHELIERGMVKQITEHAPVEHSSPHGPSEFRCHPALRPLLAPLAERVFDREARTRLLLKRAAELTLTAPASAFTMYCEAEAFAEAEEVLTQYFGMIVADEAAIGPALRMIHSDKLITHPTFISTRLFFETVNSKVPPATLHRLSVLLRRSVTRQLAAHAASRGFWPADEVEQFRGLESLRQEHSVALLRTVPLSLLAQAMTSSRILGDVPGAADLALKLELRLSATPMNATSLAADAHQAVDAHDGPVGDEQLSPWALLPYLHALALTATDHGDLAQARRAWARLQATALNFVTQPRRGHSTATNLTEVDVQTGQRWSLIALQGRAFTECHEGDLALAAQLLDQSDQLEARTGLQPPGLCWIHGAIARQAVAAENGARVVPAEQASLLDLVRDRIEPWSLPLMSEATAVQRDRGAQWALQLLEAGLRHLDRRPTHMSARWVHLRAFQAQLYSVVGNFAAAREVIARMPRGHVSTLIERARLQLFAGDDLQAIRITAAIGDAGTTVRQRADRCLIRSAAAQHAGHDQEATFAFTSALEHLEASGLQSPLWNVPFDPVHTVSEQTASRAGNELLAQVPQVARASRFEQLTAMELRTLQAIGAHQTTAATAEAMFVTLATVKKHLNSVYRKLRVRNRGEALLQASRMGLVQ